MNPRQDAQEIARNVRDAWKRSTDAAAQHLDSRADGGCSCGGQHQDAGPKRGDAGTITLRDIQGREHTYRVDDYVSEAAIRDEVDALNRVLARCGKRDQAAGFCK